MSITIDGGVGEDRRGSNLKPLQIGLVTGALAERSEGGIHLLLAFIYRELDSEETARAEVEESLRITPDYSPKALSKIIPLNDQANVDGIGEVLQKAGLK
ncbi:MAG: hypothetical protein ACE5JN_13775 [Candidatus Methylomirabilia bacterium]